MGFKNIYPDLSDFNKLNVLKQYKTFENINK